MAFDQPLEADRVDDLNFFGAFVRSPIVGSLMWILGGEKAKEEEAKQLKEQTKAALMEDTTDGFVIPPSIVRTSSASRQPKKSALKKSQPSLAGSDISDVGECAEALDGMHFIEGDSRPKRTKRKKELSWSDESGKGALAQFMDEESLRHHANATRDGSPSGRSSMSRSRSVRSRLENNTRPPEKSFLPRGIEQQHSGIVMPSKPYGADASNSGGVDSPLWGWYVRTTPPTPEMYYSRPPKSKYSSSTDTSSTGSSNTSIDEVSQPNRVFQGLPSKNKDVPMAFPSVPL